MHATVLRLRRAGARLALPRRRVEWQEGSLRLRREGSVDAMDIAHGTSSPGNGIVWTLYEPRISSIEPSYMIVRGFEREGEAAHVQEWLCWTWRSFEPHATWLMP